MYLHIFWVNSHFPIKIVYHDFFSFPFPSLPPSAKWLKVGHVARPNLPRMCANRLKTTSRMCGSSPPPAFGWFLDDVGCDGKCTLVLLPAALISRFRAPYKALHKASHMGHWHCPQASCTACVAVIPGISAVAVVTVAVAVAAGVVVEDVDFDDVDYPY